MRCFSVLALAFVSVSAFAQYDVEVTNVQVLNHQLLPTTPTIGDPFYAVQGLMTVTGKVKNLHKTITITCGGQTSKIPATFAGPGQYYWYATFNSSLYGIIPISFSVSRGKGDTNPSNDRRSSSFKPLYPFEAIERYGDKPVYVRQKGWLKFEAGSGHLDLLRAVLHTPPTTDWQGPITNYQTSEGATVVDTKPRGIPVLMSQWKNVDADPSFLPIIGQSFETTVRNTRINPDLMATIPWAAIDAPLPEDAAAWTQSESWVPTNAPQITELVNQALPADYRTTMTPWETVQSIFAAPVKRMTYNDNVFVNPLNAWDRRRGQCGDYSYLFVAAMRRIGFAARVNAGWWSGAENPLTPRDNGIVHVWAEFYMPGMGWIPADPCLSELNDPTGDYLYYLGAMPDLDMRSTIDLGGDAIFPGAKQPSNVYLQTANWRWWGNVSWNTVTDNWDLENHVPVNGTLVPYESTVVGGQPNAAIFELIDPAPDGGTPVTFTSDSPSLTVINPPTSVGAGQTYVTVSLGTKEVSSVTEATLTATFNNGETRPMKLKILPHQIQFVATQRYIAPGMPIPFAIDFGRTLTNPITVQVTTVPSNGAPVTVTVPAGSQGATGVIAPPANSVTSLVGLQAAVADGGTVTDSVLVAGN